MTDWVKVVTEHHGWFWVSSDEQRADLVQVSSEQSPDSPHRYESGDCRVHEGDVVIDLGAHIGLFTRIALDMGAACVIAVEPDADSADSFRENHRAEMKTGRVILVRSAAREKCGRVFLAGFGACRHVTEVGDECEATTVDEIVRQLSLDRVDFVKVDVEGSERFALRGASETIRRFKPNIACCVYHRKDDPSAVLLSVRSVRTDYTVTCGPVASWMTTPELYFFWR